MLESEPEQAKDMRLSTTLRAAASILILIAASSCSESPVGPLDGRTYVLRSVEGIDLPIILRPGEEPSVTLLADTIRFLDGDRFTRTVVYRDEDRAADRTEVRTEVSEGTVVRRGDELILESTCQDVILINLGQCAPPDVARRIGNLLRVHSHFPPPGEKLFLRIVG